ncbi:MAG: hypothetical protein Fur0040_12350 [Sideroxydans sp.]
MTMWRAACLAILLMLAAAAMAAKPDWKICADQVNEIERLACYDQLSGRHYQERSFLTRAWDLDGAGNPNQDGVRRLEPYRSNYVLLRHVNRRNPLPASPAPAHQTQTALPYQPNELKFQFSAKSEIGNFREIALGPFRNFRLWAGYTQKSYWQLFNGAESSPFRETNYEPELIGTLGTGAAQGWKLLNIGLSHQSNGRTNPTSRSWNRLYVEGGWEWEDYYLLARGWWRFPEKAVNDDNPDIERYIGRAEIEAHWAPESDEEVALKVRSNLNLGEPRGYVELNWSTPVRFWHLSRLSLQFSSGYGSSLIDYNFNQTALAAGLTFKDW